MKDRNALYLRKSQADQPDESIAEVLAKHRAMLIELADKMDVTISQDDIYEEVVSGESLYARPEMLRMLEQVEAGAYDGVFCMDIDRLGRGSMSEQGIILETFRMAETKIICPGKTYDLTNDADEELTEMKALFAREVPEVSDGTVKIVAVARDPGSRAKVAVISKDRDVDPVGVDDG